MKKVVKVIGIILLILIILIALAGIGGYAYSTGQGRGHRIQNRLSLF